MVLASVFMFPFQIKCHPYWPMGEDEVVEFGSFQIKNIQTVMEDHYITRELLLTYIMVTIDNDDNIPTYLKQNKNPNRIIFSD